MEKENRKDVRHTVACELRYLRAENGAPAKWVGTPIVYDAMSEPLNSYRFGQFREVIKPGAASGILARGDDVRAVVNHDPTQVLGRVGAGTLKLREDDKGVHMELTPADTSYARDLAANKDAGNVLGMSFSFELPEDDAGNQLGVTMSKADNGDTIRTISKFARIHEVSILSGLDPAYPQTSVSMRTEKSLEAALVNPSETERRQRLLALM